MGTKIKAKSKWQFAGVQLTKGQRFSVRATGTWNVHPRAFPAGHGPAGASARAPSGYALPGKREGALVGRIETGPVFLVGASYTGRATESGRLLLAINDDLDGRFGLGIFDNKGELDVVVSPKENAKSLVAEPWHDARDLTEACRPYPGAEDNPRVGLPGHTAKFLVPKDMLLPALEEQLLAGVVLPSGASAKAGIVDYVSVGPLSAGGKTPNSVRASIREVAMRLGSVFNGTFQWMGLQFYPWLRRDDGQWKLGFSVHCSICYGPRGWPTNCYGELAHRFNEYVGDSLVAEISVPLSSEWSAATQGVAEVSEDGLVLLGA